MIGHVRGVLSTYGSDAITPIVLQPDMVYANLWVLRHSYSFCSVNRVVNDTVCADANIQGRGAIEIKGSLNSVGKYLNACPDFNYSMRKWDEV